MTAFDHRRYAAPAQLDLPGREWPNKRIEQAPRWASVDLRDGNQALLEPMTVVQKQQLWRLLLKLGVKEIEVGFPSASQADYDFVRWLIEAQQIPQDVTVQVLVQAREELIIKTFVALEGVQRAIVHVYNSTSTIQRERVFGLDKAGITQIAVNGARMLQREAEKYPATAWTFQYSPESFTSTEMDYAVEICDAVMDVWQPTPQQPCIINLPSTVEVSTPNIFADQVEYFARHIERRDSMVLSVHTHNDRGCAVAAAELALMAGADRVEGTLLGNGERTGNMDMVIMAMNLYSQGIDPELDLSRPDEIIQVVSGCTGIAVHPRHPWVGELVYTAFSGSHQDAIRKCLHQQKSDEPWQVAYLPIDPKDLGRDYQAIIRVNSQSGKAGIAFVLERDYGLFLPRWMQLELAAIVQGETERQAGELESARIHALLQEHFVLHETPVSLQGYQLDCNETDSIAARLQIDGMAVTLNGEGNGAISAFMDGWIKYSGQAVHVVDFSEHAIGTGSEAVAAAYVQLSIDGQRVSGVAFDADSVSASLKAVISSLNKLSLSHASVCSGKSSCLV